MVNKIELIKIDNLIFDPENPRLPTRLRGYNYDDEVLEWMLMYENVIELMGSIGEKDYFQAEPLLVVESKKKNGKFEVIEGNRRLAAVKLLNHPNLATFKKKSVAEIVNEAKFFPKELPAIKFSKRNDILVYLGYRHITGIKEWGPLAKAKYLESLRKLIHIKDKNEEYKTLAKIIGSKASYVRSLLMGLQVYDVIEENNFFEIIGLDEVTVEFGVLYTAVGRENIATFVSIDMESEQPAKKIKVKHLKELTSWMFEKNIEGFTRLGESRNLKDLDRVVGNEKALKYFREGKPLSEAVLYTEKPVDVFYDSTGKAILNLKIARDQLHHINNPDESMTSNIDELISIGRDIKLLLKAKNE